MRRWVECLPVLVLFGCWEPHETSLFKPDGAQSNLSGLDTSAGSSSGGVGSSAGAAGSGAVAGQDSPPPTAGTTAYPVGGGGGSPAAGGTDAVIGGTASVAGSDGEGGSGHPPPASCDSIDGAVTNETNGHCYRVSLDAVDFATAREACRVVGAHLVTISSVEEDAFVSALLPQEHWLGATDDLSDTTKGVGEYRWVNDEPWGYSAWLDGQPNAIETACPEGVKASACYEHCAYQNDKAQWVDRPCWHTIASVCEWELDSDSVAK